MCYSLNARPRDLDRGRMSEMLRTEHGDFQFKVKEGLPDPYIVAEPQSRNGAMPGGIEGLGFTLHTKELAEAERIAEFFNVNVRQVFTVTK
jgi:hypothetical protein